MIGALGPLKQPGWGTEAAGTPAFLPSRYLLAALALLVLAHPPGDPRLDRRCRVVRGGWVSRGRLAAAASVTGAPAVLVIGTTLALAGPPEASRSIGAGHHRLAALARSRPVMTTWSRVARCHRWNRSGLSL
jgi:hypothetical protein